MKRDSEHDRYVRISRFIESQTLSPEVILETLRAGRGLHDESPLWDYKAKLPSLPIMPEGARVPDHVKEEYDVDMHSIVKDVVSYYNSCGGYLVVGIDDKTRSIIGYNKSFDASDLSRKVRGATDRDIQCRYEVIEVTVEGQNHKFGLLLIPRRPDGEAPVMFEKNGPQRGGSVVYRKGFYCRRTDECRIAESLDDFTFLFNDSRRLFPLNPNFSLDVVDHNLPPRETIVSNFIGREDELKKLWEWMADQFSRIRLVWGFGGLGKTSLVYKFAESFVAASPRPFKKVVWLSAKTENYFAYKDSYEPSFRIDYSDEITFLTALLLELGALTDEITDASDNSLRRRAIEHLKIFPSLIIVDDVDTLDDTQQLRLFHNVQNLISQTNSKAVVTARKSLNVLQDIAIHMRGLKFDDFCEFLEARCRIMGINLPCSPQSQEMKSFYGVTDGSPQFAQSILRLSEGGEKFHRVLERWRGTDGEGVRRAAFEREVSRLKSPECRALLVACILSPTSNVEISTICDLSSSQVEEVIAQLRQFALVAYDSNLPGGAKIVVPTSVAMMRELVELRVTDREELKRRCKEHRRRDRPAQVVVADAISRSVALLRDNRCYDAIKVIEASLNKIENNGDLLCMLGRCLYQSGPDRYTEAEAAFGKSFNNKCVRRELFDYWVRVRKERQDWDGVVEVSERAHKATGDNAFTSLAIAALIEKGDLLAAAGQWQLAETCYHQGADRAIAIVRNNPNTPSLTDLRDNLSASVRRWVDAVRRSAGTFQGDRKVFNTAYMAVTHYNQWEAHYCEIARISLSGAMRSVESRPTPSVTSIGKLELDIKRMEKMSRHMEFSAKSVAISNFLKVAHAELLGRLDKLK